MPTSNHQRQQRRAAARRAAVATDDVPDAVPRPPGRGPRNHFWDPRPPGVWRHNESNRTSAERRVSRAPAAATPPPSAADGGRESTRRGATRPSPSRLPPAAPRGVRAARPFETARGAVRETSPAGMAHYITRRGLSFEPSWATLARVHRPAEHRLGDSDGPPDHAFDRAAPTASVAGLG